MCDTDDRAEVIAAESLPASLEWTGEVLPLEPVDELSVLTICDNTVDILLPDQGPAKRLPLAGMARLAPPLEAPTILGGTAADVPLAQHGFSALVEVRKGDRVRRLLFDTGMTPDGCAGNLCLRCRHTRCGRRDRRMRRRRTVVVAGGDHSSWS